MEDDKNVGNVRDLSKLKERKKKFARRSLD